ncbi:hypothetical protein TIFTF001_030342 [Ficus carica]|uniref:Uncharacterized protein n=1 Tax=Ficus carica TaxID=3494 RepID=A0AA88J3M9_FICCA|nr:hypothetical protein TIFTF001_030342 [Ficus carica]
MPPKKKTPTPAPTPLGKPSKFPINPTVSPPPSSTPRILPHQLLQFHQPLSPLLCYPLLQANKVQHLLHHQRQELVALIEGKNTSRLVFEIGIIVRDRAPLKVKGWSKVDVTDKKVIYTRIKKRSDASIRNRDKLPHVRRDSGNIAKAIEGGMKESNGDTTPVKYVVLLDNE